ncbi:MAG TPA: family 78 glycoside hydrolase catalytic domain, partial [Candidatus Limnocylindrales bacterium]
RQAAYEIDVTEDGGPAWSSGRIESADSVLVAWPAPGLASRDRRKVRVRVWGAGGDASAWSDSAAVEAGLLSADDWSAELIGPDRDLGDRPDRPPVMFRQEFKLRGAVVQARLYVTAHGVYEATINGQRIGDQVLAPGWTSYKHRLRYQTFDVTALLASGANVVGATVAEGWYSGHLGFHGGRRRIWGEDVAFLAQLEVRYADREVEAIVTDGDWLWANGPTTSAGIYAGETHDARLDPRDWAPVRMLGREQAELVAPVGPPIRRTQELAAVAITTSPTGRTIVDFGQNLVGRVRLRVSGDAGTTITLHHAEVIENGEVATRPLRGAAAVDSYTLRGGGVEEWEPRFTSHGFRYVDVEGWPGALRSEDIRAIVFHSDMARTGWFECSEPLLNRLHENIVWTMRGNFMDVPTDCPQRDERLGWGGDLSIFAPSASFLYDCSGTLSSWLADVAIEQAAYGTVPFYVPWFQITWPLAPSSVWGDVAVTVPWLLYERFGDAGLLRRQYSSMKAWVDQITEIAGPSHLWQSGLHLGDWLDPSAPADAPEAARTDRYFIASAYHALTAQILARTADVIGETADARHYGELATAIREAFRAEYVSANGLVVSDAQTAYSIALEFDLLTGAQRERAGRRLVDLVRANDHRIGTGLVGARLVADALTNAGAIDTAYHLLLQRKAPSWLYPVTMGATTVWERWDSMLPDGSLNPGDMLSFNHYSLGSVADWLHRTVAGLAPAEPGYRRMLVAPRPGGGLSRASAAHETPYGRAEVAWTRDGARLDVDVLVPVGATATVRLPDPEWKEVEVGSGRHHFTCSFRRVEDDPARPPAPAPLGLAPEGESGVFEA